MKFNLSEKVKYMAFGALLTFVGFMFGNLNSGIDAQSQPEVIDELRVRKLKVYEGMTLYGVNDLADPEPRVTIAETKDGGNVTAYGKSGEGYASIGLDKDGGILSVSAIGGEGKVSIGINRGNGLMNVTDKNGVGGVTIGVIDGDGVGFTTNRLGEHRKFMTE